VGFIMHLGAKRQSILLCSFLIGACGGPPPVESIPEVEQVTGGPLSAAVDVVRDELGIPHIYGQSLADVSFAQGYLMASDRLVQMDFVRRFAAGTLAELAGDLSESIVDGDIARRVHHMYRTAEDSVKALQTSSDPADREVLAALDAFAAGVNRYVEELNAGRFRLPPAFAFVYDPSTFRAWVPADSVVIGLLIAFNLSFDASSEIQRSAVAAAVKARFEGSGRPELEARRGLGRDLELLEPVWKTYTQAGGFQALKPLSAAARAEAGAALALYEAAAPAVRGLGNDRLLHPENGSNNWVVGPSLSASGHVIVANDPHLSLSNPATFYLVHLVVRGGERPLEVMGAQFPGAPGVILGFNRHVSWAATTSVIDVTDVYEETVVPCDGSSAPCVQWKGQKVPLIARNEVFKIGKPGKIVGERTVTLWDVPHHGPILPRVTAAHDVEPLGSTELSVRWTGHEVSQLLRAVLGLNTAGSVEEARRALEQHFKVGGQNWVLGDDQGHFGWTQAVRVPVRPAGTTPWKVLPGDGTAEWQGDLDLRWVPQAFDPPSGYLVTANADPIGVTDTGVPFSTAPDGTPLYIGADYDPGSRVARITEGLEALKQKGKISADDMERLQADTVSLWNRAFAPVFLDAAGELAAELAQPGSRPELTPVAQLASPASQPLVAQMRDLVAGWDFDMKTDSRAATLMAVWVNRFVLLALEDELDVLGLQPGSSARLRLVHRMCTAPASLSTGLTPTGDALLFDDLLTPAVETKRQIAARALLDALDYLLGALGTDATSWTWGRVHTLVLEGLLPLDHLRIPLKSESPDAFPRPGGNGTVDVADHGLGVGDYGYGHGPNLRAVYEMDPAGPRVRNVIPGGQTWDPDAPHYRDLLNRWVANQSAPMLFDEGQVAESARKELAAHDKIVFGAGRVRFVPR
jgi:penicillin amidase